MHTHAHHEGLQRHFREKTRPARGIQWLSREKARPARDFQWHFREKTRPARPKTAFFGHFGLAGRTFSRSHPLRAAQGELFGARSHSRPSRANYFAFRRHVRDAGRRISRTGLDPGRRNMATLKPPTPLHAPNNAPLKPASPLCGENAPKTPFSHPQRRWWFHFHTDTSEQRRQGFQTTGPPGRHRLATTPAGGRARLRPLGGDDTTAPKFRMQFDWVKFQ